MSCVNRKVEKKCDVDSNRVCGSCVDGMKFDKKLFACVNSNVTQIEVWTDIGTVLNESIMCYDEPPHINHTLIVSDVIYLIFVGDIIVLILLICIIIVYLINKKYNIFYFFVI